MVYEEDKIVIQNDYGEENTFYKLLQFFSKKTNKRYLVYTDNQKNEDGSLKLYSSIIIGSDDNIEFIPVVEEEDIDIVSQAIVQTKLNLMENK